MDEPRIRYIKAMKNVKLCSLMSTFVVSALLMAPMLSATAAQTAKVDPDVVSEIVDICVTDAKEDQVSEQDLIGYLSVCINDELESNNYDVLSHEEVTKVIKQSKAFQMLKTPA